MSPQDWRLDRHAGRRWCPGKKPLTGSSTRFRAGVVSQLLHQLLNESHAPANVPWAAAGSVREQVPRAVALVCSAPGPTHRGCRVLGSVEGRVGVVDSRSAPKGSSPRGGEIAQGPGPVLDRGLPAAVRRPPANGRAGTGRAS